MTQVESLAQFATGAAYEQLSGAAREQLKLRILDALGCALGAHDAEPPRRVREEIVELGEAGRSTLIGGGCAAPDRAAFYNGALVRYLDFNDSYLAPGETCHPSDLLAPVLAAAERADASGVDLLAALGVAYQVQCRLCDVAPVRDAGFDHTTLGAYAAAAGASRALGLDAARAAHAIAIAGTASNALRVTRTGRLSHWKGLAAASAGASAVWATLLAARGITGPLEVFEGEKGFMDAIAGCFELDWSRENLEGVRGTIVKRHNAEIHSQTAIEAALTLRASLPAGADIEDVLVEIFDVAYRIIGGGEEGDKTTVQTKEDADHSLPYLVAVALLDGQVMPDQYAPERIRRQDVQQLLLRVRVAPRPEFSRRFPAAMPARVTLRLRSGRTLVAEATDYPGFTTRPPDWRSSTEKFDALAEAAVSPEERDGIKALIQDLEHQPVRRLARALGAIGHPASGQLVGGRQT